LRRTDYQSAGFGGKSKKGKGPELRETELRREGRKTENNEEEQVLLGRF